MRTLATIALIAATFAGLAHAAPAPAPATQVDGASVSISAPRGATYVIPSYQQDDYNRQFALSNGNRLSLTVNNERFYAQIDKQKPFEIVPTGPTTFVGKHRQFELRLDEFMGERVHDVVVGLPAN